MARHVEIIGAGFAGLAAACAFAQRGWSVRVHERGDRLRAAGAGIYIYENGLRVLEALGAYDDAVAGAPFAHTREVRDEKNMLVSTHRWGDDSRVFSVVRQHVIDALAASARRSGAEIVISSEGVAATPDGEVTFVDGAKRQADLVIACDGVNSKLRDSLGLLAKRKPMPDGAIRLLIEKTDDERRSSNDNKTIEYWSGSRRVLYTPCSETQIYVALTMLHDDPVATAVPIDVAAWTRWFPHLAALFQRIGDRGRYDRFELIKLRRWSSGLVAVIGDASHALPPNIGQGGGCSMMNALSLAVYLDREPDIATALETWETKERGITEHTQNVSVFLGLPTTWPPLLRRAFFNLAGRSRWMIKQRTMTARHRPTGTKTPQHYGATTASG